MSIYNVNWRQVFIFILPPSKRDNQVEDLGQSYLTTISTESDLLATSYDTMLAEQNYSGIKMVFQAVLNEVFSSATFVVETVTTIPRYVWAGIPAEYFSMPLGLEGERIFTYIPNSADGTPADASIIIHVPASIFSSNLDGVKVVCNKLKVAGKKIKYVSL